MKSKRYFLISSWLLFSAFLLSGHGFANDEAPSPEAFIEQSTYEFSPVIAGTEVEHRFPVMNKGNATLNIINVYSG